MKQSVAVIIAFRVETEKKIICIFLIRKELYIYPFLIPRTSCEFVSNDFLRLFEERKKDIDLYSFDNNFFNHARNFYRENEIYFQN